MRAGEKHPLSKIDRPKVSVVRGSLGGKIGRCDFAPQGVPYSHARRFKTPHGEIDLIASTSSTLVFVEVKARANSSDALYAVTPHQQRRLLQAAEIYLPAHPTSNDMRFDVFLVKPRAFPVHLKNVLWYET